MDNNLPDNSNNNNNNNNNSNNNNNGNKGRNNRSIMVILVISILLTFLFWRVFDRVSSDILVAVYFVLLITLSSALFSNTILLP